MHVTIRNYSGATDLADALAARGDEIRELVGPIEGFRAYYLVRTAEGTTSISVFDDRAGAEASTAAAAAWMAEHMSEVHAGPPQVSAGDVAYSF